MDDNCFSRDELLSAAGGSVYKLAILAAKRALQLADGEKPLVEKPSAKALDNALREISSNKVKVKNTKGAKGK